MYAPTGRETAAAGCAGGLATAGLEMVEVVSDRNGVARSGLVRGLELIAGGAAGVLAVQAAQQDAAAARAR